MIETMDQGTSVAANAVSGQRGPVEHVRRQQILQAANEHFRLYGYRKTTLADIAKSIHLSTPYLYKFFDSKQAIGEAICSTCLNATLAEIEEMIAATPSPVERLRRIFIGLGKNGWRLLNEQRKMHDIVAASFEERWSSLDRFNEGVFQIVRRVIVQGRESGDFERKTPLEETCRAIARTTQLFFHPVLLEQAGEIRDEDVLAVANMVVRSLTA